jgi:hypothetical protein
MAILCGAAKNSLRGTGRYNKPVQYGRESAYKSRAAGGNASLDDCMQESNTIREK